MPEYTSGKAGPGSKSDRPISDRPIAEGAGAAREFVQQGAAFTKDMSEKAKAAAGETSKIFEQTYSNVAKGAAEFNIQWIEMLRVNTNSTLDFARQLFGVKSPSEYLELSAAHTRKQFETLTEQAQHLTGLAQKVTSEAVQPLQAGVKSVLTKAA